jgi:hypothetical protein
MNNLHQRGATDKTDTTAAWLDHSDVGRGSQQSASPAPGISQQRHHISLRYGTLATVAVMTSQEVRPQVLYVMRALQGALSLFFTSAATPVRPPGFLASAHCWQRAARGNRGTIV